MCLEIANIDTSEKLRIIGKSTLKKTLISTKISQLAPKLRLVDDTPTMAKIQIS